MEHYGVGRWFGVWTLQNNKTRFHHQFKYGGGNLFTMEHLQDIGIKTDGTLWTWDNGYGKLGQNTKYLSPTKYWSSGEYSYATAAVKLMEHYGYGDIMLEN